MKKLLSILFAGLSALAMTIEATAQINSIPFNNNSSDNEVTPTANVIAVDAQALRNFRKNFPCVTGDSWVLDKNGYVVRFTSTGIQNWAFLDKRGKCKNFMRYYTEKELPPNVRNQVKNTYSDFSIKSVKEVSNKKSTAYLVTIEDNTTWKTIRVADGEINVLEEYTK